MTTTAKALKCSSARRCTLIGQCVQQHGGVYNELGDTAQAFAMRKSMAIHKESDNQRAYSGAIGNLGLVYMEQGLFAQAIALFNESLSPGESMGDKGGTAKTLHDLGELLRRQGKLDSAMVCFQRSRGLRAALGDEQGLASSAVKHGLPEHGQRRTHGSGGAVR
ncbi:MAG: tetratricopeptide repeat protein [Flavobacteriales bacterium]|nr:tetratricopeptide repeat protein [Flavobacteriales bacterium]